ncbi:MAG: toprim domain-containing protein, partial [Nitrososphaera sp.]
MDLKGKFVEHKGCPDCKSSDALAVYKKENGQYDAYCFSCGYWTPEPYGNQEIKTITKESFPTATIEEIKILPSVGDTSRSLSQEACKHFEVKTEFSTTDGKTAVAHYYPITRRGEIVGYKKRTLPKFFSVIGDGRNSELFGQLIASKTGSKRLYITEGELDAISLWQILTEDARGTEWAKFIPCVVSLPHGAKSATKDIGRNLDFVRSFEQVILCFDMDEDGRDAVEEVARLLPSVLVASYPEKDANEMLMKGKGQQLAKTVLFGAKKHKPPAVVSVEDVWDRAVKLPEMGLSWPWPSLTKLTYGIRRKMIYGLGAGVGIGKTEFIHEAESHLIRAHNKKVGCFMFEEDVGRTVKALAEKMFNKPFTVPDGPYTEKDLIDAVETLKPYVYLFDSRVGRDWNEIKSAIRYMVIGEGIQDIFLDHLTALVAHISSSEANDHINLIMSDMSQIVNELDCTIYYCSHLNPPQAGDPHERGGRVLESQFTGSRGAIKWSNYLLGLERNKDPQLPEEQRNTSKLVLLKDRE